jgi:hypothetical protein
MIAAPQAAFLKQVLAVQGGTTVCTELIRRRKKQTVQFAELLACTSGVLLAEMQSVWGGLVRARHLTDSACTFS